MLIIIRVHHSGMTAEQVFEDCAEAAEAEFNYWKGEGVQVEMIPVHDEAGGVQ